MIKNKENFSCHLIYAMIYLKSLRALKERNKFHTGKKRKEKSALKILKRNWGLYKIELG